MPDFPHILLKQDELIELIVKHAKVHDGKWTLSVEFNVGIGLMAPGPDQPPNPSALIAVARVGIQRVPEGPGAKLPPPNTPIFDAAKFNPLKKAAKIGRLKR